MWLSFLESHKLLVLSEIRTELEERSLNPVTLNLYTCTHNNPIITVNHWTTLGHDILKPYFKGIKY